MLLLMCVNTSPFKERITFLHLLHQKLLSSHVIIPNKDRVVNQIAWADLAEVVYEQASLLVESLQDSQEKVSYIHFFFFLKLFLSF